MSDDVLAAIPVDIREIIEDLRFHWQDHPDAKYNATAFSNVKQSGDNLMFCCPNHSERNPSCGIRTSYPYTWNCFGCGASGNLPSLIAHAINAKGELGGYQYLLSNYISLSVEDRPKIDIDELFDGNDLDKKRTIPEEEVAKFMKRRHPYIVNRGFSDRTLRKYEIGYDDATKSITFPVRTSQGQVRFIKRRFVNRKGFLNESGIYKKDIVYGLYYILQSPNPITEIFLTESETDTMACYEGKMAAGALLGRILFKEQVRELMLSGIKTVNLFFDNDKAGVACTIKSYQTLASTPIKVNVVLYPGAKWGIDTTDSNDITLKDANDILQAGKFHQIKILPYEVYLEMVNKARLVDVKLLLEGEDEEWVLR